MKKLLKFTIALCMPFMMVACGESEGEILSDLSDVDRSELNARCDAAIATILNSDETLACEVAFQPCADLTKYHGYVIGLECQAGFIDCPVLDDDESGAVDISAEDACEAAYETVLPPDLPAQDHAQHQIWPQHLPG